jgi:hypothetical protein
MLFKILIFSVIILAIYIVFFKNKVKKNVSKNIENFVECKKCETFVDIKDAIISSSGYICSECVKDKK